MAPLPPITPSFTAKKFTILTSLAAPSSTYTDLSPKGTVDEAIKDLINRINALEGIVTTSSCAGRISVFLEGRKKGAGGETKGLNEGIGEGKGGGEGQAAVPGGKGLGGRWLFVSHEPIENVGEEVVARLGLSNSGDGFPVGSSMDHNHSRIARFQFEPMILHIMAASLRHAQPILSAAINAGFRESGIQSLKNIEDVNAFPMIAIRSSGLALESLIGTSPNDTNDCDERVESIVSEDYLNMLITLANERFKTNAERMERFANDLFEREARRGRVWEDGEVRKERKRAEGMRKQKALHEQKVAGDNSNTVQTGAAGNETGEIGIFDPFQIST